MYSTRPPDANIRTNMYPIFQAEVKGPVHTPLEINDVFSCNQPFEDQHASC